ncbi:MAG: hypothetical protein KKD17_02650 [Nanoarchaeota archaeon]|nr:hypothetical protein [Nanoarchaeota archaeon]
MSDYTLLIRGIIEQMETIIGPVAMAQARQVEGLEIGKKIAIKGDPQKAIHDLLDRYKSLMGPVAITIAKKGAKQVLEKNPGLKVPAELR